LSERFFNKTGHRPAGYVLRHNAREGREN